jgi:hypothetical protein
MFPHGLGRSWGDWGHFLAAAFMAVFVLIFFAIHPFLCPVTAFNFPDDGGLLAGDYAIGGDGEIVVHAVKDEFDRLEVPFL